MWVISNFEIKNNSGLNKIVLENYIFYSTINGGKFINPSPFWFVDGFVFSRNGLMDKTTNLKNEGINKLYKEFGENFIKNVKGNFVLLQLANNQFKVYSDRFGVKKFFYWQKGEGFIITDDLKTLSQNVDLTPSKSNMANYAIDYHFTGGTTAFEDVWHNISGQVIEYKEGKLHLSVYWQPEDLLKLKKRDVPITEISDILSSVVDRSLDLINTDRISLSLTGGADTRNLLAIFLNKGIKPHLYTYGNPKSDDCVKASAIALGFDLNHSIYDIQMNAELFEKYSRKIINYGCGLASIHRVHRIIAVDHEKKFADYMFLGTLGGEFIKGVSEDDYIVPPIVYENWENHSISKDQLKDYLNRKFILSQNLDLESLLSTINSQPYMKGSVVKRKIAALSHITAHLHDAQDVNLYSSAMDEVFTPFLDIDYLELVFSSKYTFDNKEKIKNKYLKRLNNPVYASSFIKATYPPLLNFLYSGDHKPSEVLFNKYFAALMKIYRKRRYRAKYQPNFPLGKWMEDFVEINLPICNDYQEIRETFDVVSLMKDLKTEVHSPKEAYWLKFTNPIMMRFIIEEFN